MKKPLPFEEADACLGVAAHLARPASLILVYACFWCSCASYAGLPTSKVNQKVEPTPGVLSTPTCPM